MFGPNYLTNLVEGMETHSSIPAWRIQDRGTWWATVHRVTKSRTQLKWLHFHFHAIWKRIHEKNYALKMFCSLVNIALMPISSCDILLQWCMTSLGFPRGSVGKESTCNAGDAGAAGSIPGFGRSPGGGHGNPLWYSCLENLMGTGLVGYSPWGRKESSTT